MVFLQDVYTKKQADGIAAGDFGFADLEGAGASPASRSGNRTSS